MASTYSNLKLQLMATGENSGGWGTITNTNLSVSLQEAIADTAAITFASGAYTLSYSDTNATLEGRHARLKLGGTSGGAQNLIVPTIEKLYVVENGTADIITVKTTAGTGIAVPVSATMWLYADGTNVVDVVSHISALTSTTGTFTGLVTVPDLTLSADNPEILGGDTNGVTYLSAGASTILGGNLRLYGDTHATKANDIEFYGSATLQMLYDDSASKFDFQANAITTTGVITGGQVLDDSGTFSGVLSDATSGGNVSATTDTGTWEECNGWLTAMCQFVNINTGGMTAGNALKLQGLPKPIRSGVGQAVGSLNHDQWTVDGVGIAGWMLAGDDVVEFRQLSNGGADTTVIVSDLTSGNADFALTIRYPI